MIKKQVKNIKEQEKYKTKEQDETTDAGTDFIIYTPFNNDAVRHLYFRVLSGGQSEPEKLSDAVFDVFR